MTSDSDNPGEKLKAILADSNRGMPVEEITMKLMVLGYGRDEAEKMTAKFVHTHRSSRVFRLILRMVLGCVFLVTGVLTLLLGPVRIWGWGMLFVILGIAVLAGTVKLGL